MDCSLLQQKPTWGVAGDGCATGIRGCCRTGVEGSDEDAGPSAGPRDAALNTGDVGPSLGDRGAAATGVPGGLPGGGGGGCVGGGGGGCCDVVLLLLLRLTVMTVGFLAVESSSVVS